MLDTNDFIIWNLTHQQTVTIGSQSLFNILGRLKNPLIVLEFYFRVNQGEEKTILFNISDRNYGRLERTGDFNINSIDISELKETNQLYLRVEYEDHCEETSIIFHTRRVEIEQPRFTLNLDGIGEPQEVGQVVDGYWQVDHSSSATPNIYVPPAEAGYDRIFLFGSQQWTSGYQITARLEATAWAHRVHLLGLLFKWQAHDKGDGSYLPLNWNTGLGIFDSRSETLRIRYGVNVRKENGHKVGDTLVGEAPLDPTSASSFSKSRFNILRREPRRDYLELKRPYWFHLIVHPQIHSLAVWADDCQRPAKPQVVIKNPTELLSFGSVGVIAYNCGIRIYNFEVSPYNPLLP